MDHSILIGLSGGVDSAAAASLLLRAGYAVTGAVIRTGAEFDTGPAETVAAQLGIAVETAGNGGDFDEKVIAPFCRDYAEGLTPSPCVGCNASVKWPTLLGLADRLGVEKIATGHYAAVETDGATGRRYVRRHPSQKDQSYFLCRLSQEQLARTVFPLAEYTKPQARAVAAEAGLEAADRKDSQDICFLPDGDHARLIERRLGAAPGEIIAPDGTVCGRHSGVWNYTIGQRKGLGVALGRRVTVSRIDGETRRVWLSDDVPAADGCVCRGVVRQRLPEDAAEASGYVKIRAAAVPVEASVAIADGRAVFRFASPVNAVTPGQFAVLYDADGGVLLSGRITGETDV